MNTWAKTKGTLMPFRLSQILWLVHSGRYPFFRLFILLFRQNRFWGWQTISRTRHRKIRLNQEIRRFINNCRIRRRIEGKRDLDAGSSLREFRRVAMIVGRAAVTLIPSATDGVSSARTLTHIHDQEYQLKFGKKLQRGPQPVKIKRFSPRV